MPKRKDGRGRITESELARGVSLALLEEMPDEVTEDVYESLKAKYEAENWEDVVRKAKDALKQEQEQQTQEKMTLTTTRRRKFSLS